jgi:Icc protein
MHFERRSFLKLLPALTGLTYVSAPETSESPAKISMRFIVASDGHYGQPDTDFKSFHSDLISWVNKEKLTKRSGFSIFQW